MYNTNINDVIFLDIETVPEVYHFSELEEKTKALWDKKTRFIQDREGISPAQVYERAGIYSEFGKVVCISIGLVVRKEGEEQIRLKSFANADETKLLQEFKDMLTGKFEDPKFLLCAHNGKEFDFPYLCRRMLINGIRIPDILNMAGKKPWEVKHIDTMDLWKFGDYKHYTSLELLTHIFKIPTPKDDIDGSEVAAVFYEENDLDRIVQYCEKDVIATIQLMRKFLGMELIHDDFIIST